MCPSKCTQVYIISTRLPYLIALLYSSIIEFELIIFLTYNQDIIHIVVYMQIWFYSVSQWSIERLHNADFVKCCCYCFITVQKKCSTKLSDCNTGSLAGILAISTRLFNPVCTIFNILFYCEDLVQVQNETVLWNAANIFVLGFL